MIATKTSKWGMAGLICALIGFGAMSVVQASDCGAVRDLYKSGNQLTNLTERKTAFERAVSACPSFGPAQVNLADCMQRLAVKDLAKNYPLLDEAVARYEAAINKCDAARFPDDCEKARAFALLGLGECRDAMGMKHDALKAFEKVMELAPVGSKPFLKASAAVEHLKGSMLREKSVRNGGPKTSEQIISSLAESKKQTDALQLMGFASHSVIKDRQAFTNILFNEWSATLEKPESLAQLEELAKALNSDEVTQFKIMIEGHTDDRGDPQRNRELSMERARSVGHYLVKNLGVQPGRITVAGFGFSRPRVPNDTPDNRQSNRRVEVVFLGADAQEE